MKKPHKHAELIKAWADGAVIQLSCDDEWLDCHCNLPKWKEGNAYRVKPEEKAIHIYYVKSAICDVAEEGIGCVGINVNLSEHYIIITYNPNTKTIEDITWKAF